MPLHDKRHMQYLPPAPQTLFATHTTRPQEIPAFPPDTALLLIDDHPLILSGVAALLAAGGVQVSTAKSLADARQLLTQNHYTLTLLDINLGQNFGLELLSPEQLPHLGRIVIFSGVSEVEIIQRGFSLGAHAFIPKNSEPEDLPVAISALLGHASDAPGKWVWCPERRQLIESQDYFPRDSLLTPKEREVFLLLRDGLLDKQIADVLDLSVNTVRVHIRAIKRKRGHNRRFEQNA